MSQGEEMWELQAESLANEVRVVTCRVSRNGNLLCPVCAEPVRVNHILSHFGINHRSIDASVLSVRLELDGLGYEVELDAHV